MKSTIGTKDSAGEKSCTSRLRKDLYIRVEEALNLRKAVSIRKNIQSTKAIEDNPWPSKQK